jgi:hypothetical protein
MLAKMDPAEVSALNPLEQMIHVPSVEEEWQLLETSSTRQRSRKSAVQ